MRIENVVRILSEFRKDKIISIEGTTIEILQPDKVEWMKNQGYAKVSLLFFSLMLMQIQNH